MQKTHETATGAGSFTAVPLPEFRSKDAEASRGTTAADATARDSNTEKRVFVGSILSVVFGVDVGGTEREVGGYIAYSPPRPTIPPAYWIRCSIEWM